MAVASAEQRSGYQPPDRVTADRHAAFARDLLEHFAAGDRRAAGELMARLQADPAIDPWTLLMGAGILAARRPRSRARRRGR
jgi:hypothetical protein